MPIGATCGRRLLREIVGQLGEGVREMAKLTFNVSDQAAKVLELLLSDPESELTLEYLIERGY